MNLLFDTNIVLFIIRARGNSPQLARLLNPDAKSIFLSIVSVAELYSIAFQNQWNPKKVEKLEAFVRRVQVIMVDDFLTDSYRQIDAYSQRKHPDFSNYPFATPRNMGKNDLWIAATASLLELKLVTTDLDFNHLENQYIAIERIDLDLIRAVIDAS